MIYHIRDSFSHRIKGEYTGKISEYIDAVAKSVEFNEQSLTLDVNQTATVSVTTNPLNHSAVYTVADSSVATVDYTGKVKGLKTGKTTITASFGNFSDTI